MKRTVMRERVVLAYAGDLASSAAIPWLIETHAADVVTVSLDIGQGRDLGPDRHDLDPADVVLAAVVREIVGRLAGQ